MLAPDTDTARRVDSHSTAATHKLCARLYMFLVWLSSRLLVSSLVSEPFVVFFVVFASVAVCLI